MVSASYETPLWTLIGVVIGFVLSYLYNLILQNRQYKASTHQAIERIKKVIHIPDVQQAKRRLADLLPQFKEKEQIVILEEVGRESCLNDYSQPVAQHVLDELRWLGFLFEMEEPSGETIRTSKQDRQMELAIQGALTEMGINIAELHRSKKLFNNTLNLLQILDKRFVQACNDTGVVSSIQTYESVGRWSVGRKDKFSHYRIGIDKSINHLTALKKYIEDSSFSETKKSKLINMADVAISIIEKRYLENR